MHMLMVAWQTVLWQGGTRYCFSAQTIRSPELLQGGGSHTSGRRRAQGCTLVLPPPPSPLLCLSSPPLCLVLAAAHSPLPSTDAPASSRCTVPLHQYPLWFELALLSLLTCLTPIAVLFLLTRTLHGSSRR